MKYLHVLLFLFIVSFSYTQDNLIKLNNYILNNRCKNPIDNNCLEATSYIATRSDGRRVKISGVYLYRSKNNMGRIFEPHFLSEYIKLLRDTYAGQPNVYNRTQLYNQLDYLVSKTVDRNGALVWENPEGIAQGMEQAEYAALFASCANVFRQHGDLKTAKGFMTIALKMFRSLNLQAGVRTGGVTTISGYCGAKRARFRPGYWFHSRGLGITDAPGVRTVLNQHFHVIRDMLLFYINVQRSPELIAPAFGSPNDVLNDIEDKAIGGLYHLAFSEGHKKSAPNRPPNIAQFMNLKTKAIGYSEIHTDGNPLSYYWSFYEFDMRTGQGVDIAHENTCHYHTHILNLVASINNNLEDSGYKSIFLKSKDGWRLYEALNALLEGKGEPTGMIGSKNAIYQFYRSERPAIKQRRENCPQDKEQLYTSSIGFYSSIFD